MYLENSKLMEAQAPNTCSGGVGQTARIEASADCEEAVRGEKTVLRTS